METLLPQFPHLKYLTLQTNGSYDLIDGYRWQVLACSLIKFDFRISLEHFPDFPYLDSFQTSFWQEEKHWYVAYHNKCLFSVPHFTPIRMKNDNLSPILSTVPNISILYDGVTELVIKSVPVDTPVYFTHIKTLILKCSISTDILLPIIDLSQIEHLTLLSVDDLSKLFALECMMPRLYELTVSKIVTVDCIMKIEKTIK